MLQNSIPEQTIKNKVGEILSRREFQQTKGENPIIEMIGRIWESIQEWVKKLLENTQMPQRESHMLPDVFNAQVLTVLKIILIFLAAILLFFLIRLLVKRLYMNRRIKRSQTPQAHDYIEDPDSLTSKLQMLVEQKDYTAALRYLFVAVLLALHQRKIIRVEKWKTNRAYIREIGLNDQNIVIPMREFSVIFNECCYRDRSVDENGFNAWLDFYHKLLEKET